MNSIFKLLVLIALASPLLASDLSSLTNAQLKTQVNTVTQALVRDARGWQAQDTQLRAKEKESGGANRGPGVLRQVQRGSFGSDYRKGLIDQANALHAEVLKRLKLPYDKRSFNTDPVNVLHESDHLQTLAEELP